MSAVYLLPNPPDFAKQHFVITLEQRPEYGENPALAFRVKSVELKSDADPGHSFGSQLSLKRLSIANTNPNVYNAISSVYLGPLFYVGEDVYFDLILQHKLNVFFFRGTQRI